jgi:hypothetical protein
MVAGVVTALAQRFFGSSLDPDWSFLNEERWLMPIIGLVGLVATVIGSLVSAPTAAPVLRHFYNRTLPFGFWSPDRDQLPPDLRRRVAAEHRREIAALPLALLFQIAAFMTPMLAIIRNWEALAVSVAVTAIAFAGLYVVWLRRIEESDAIVAEAQRVLPKTNSSSPLPLRGRVREG